MAAVKQDFHRELMDRWKDIWMASPRQLKLSQLDPHFTYRCYAKLQSELRRQQISILTQICTGHIPLNFYLHHIKKSETSNCTACQGQRSPVKETLTHFLFECKAYNRERHELDCQMRRDSRDLAALLSTKKGVNALINYVNKMGCLHSGKGKSEYTIS